MKTTQPEETIKKEHDTLLCEFGNSFTLLPRELVSSIDFATNAAIIPFGIAPIEGLVITQEGACLQLDAATLCNTNVRSGKYSVNIRTSKGIVRLRVDSVNQNFSGNSHNHKTEFQCLKAIEDFLEDCEKPIEKSVEKDRQSNQEKLKKSIVLCRIGNQVIGLDSDGISFFERPVKLHQLRATPNFSYLVELENGKLLNGIDLSAALNLDIATSAPPMKWAIGIKNKDERFALVAEDLIGLEQHEIDHFQYLNHSMNKSCWLKHPKFGPIEVLAPCSFVNNESAMAEPNELHDTALVQTHASPSIPAHGIGIKCNKFDLVLPSSAVESVGEVIELSDLKHKPSKNTIATYDISKLFSDEIDIKKNKKRLITVKDLSEKLFALLVPDVYNPKNENTWTTPHILPKPLGKLIKATQVSNGRCEILVRDEFISELSAPEFDKFKKESFCGWFTPL